MRRSAAIGGRGAVRRGVLARLAARVAVGAEIPVFVAVGCGGRDARAALRLQRRLRVVDTPRQANLLVVAGTVPLRLLRPLLRIHDQMSHPRATLLWPAGRTEPPSGRPSDLDRFIPGATRIEDGSGPEDVADRIGALHEELLRGGRDSEPLAQPDVPAAPWRGVGPHGQGGKGMMGGRPYGRPLPMRGPDRDGLELDRLPLRVGPFFPAFPPGLTLHPTLQGDVVQTLEVGPNPFEPGSHGPDSFPLAGAEDGAWTGLGTDPFTRALESPVAVGELEAARARSHLLALGEALRLHGLDALGRRALRLAARSGPGLSAAGAAALGDEVLHLWRGIRRFRGLEPATRGVGILGPDVVEDSWGPVARAAGLEADARADDPAYDGLGFRPLVREAGDAAARWEQRLEEAVQALELAARAAEAERLREPGPPLEAPRGRLEAGGPAGGLPLARLPALLTGMEWGDAVATLASLDADLEAAACHRAAAGLGPEELGEARRDRGRWWEEKEEGPHGEGHGGHGEHGHHGHGGHG